MLAIRMQRVGRKKQAMFRVVVQEHHVAPTSGRVVARLGSVNPHAKTSTLDKALSEKFLSHGAQPSDRVVRLFEQEGIRLPKWVQKPGQKQRTIRNPEKLRKNRPASSQAETQSAAAEPASPPAEATEPTEETAQEANGSSADEGAVEVQESEESKDAASSQPAE
jgi:small subunit ribosomal protein S16